MDVPLDRHAVRASYGLQFSQAEIAELLVLAVDQAEERVLAIELGGVPGPAELSGVKYFTRAMALPPSFSWAYRAGSCLRTSSGIN